MVRTGGGEAKERCSLIKVVVVRDDLAKEGGQGDERRENPPQS